MDLFLIGLTALLLVGFLSIAGALILTRSVEKRTDAIKRATRIESHEMELFGNGDGKRRIADYVNSAYIRRDNGNHSDVPLGTQQFLALVPGWVEPTLGGTALAVQTHLLLGESLPSWQKSWLVDLVRQHWSPSEQGFRPAARAPVSLFGCWAARTILRAVSDFPYESFGPPTAMGPRLISDLLGSERKVTEWRCGVRRCLDENRGFREFPVLTRPIGPVTTDAGATILFELGDPLSAQVLENIAMYEAEQCITSVQLSRGGTGTIGTYLAREFEEGDRVADGRATRHIFSTFDRFYPGASIPQVLLDKRPGILSSFRDCSEDGSQPCVAHPGARSVSILDTQAWYDLNAMVSSESGRRSGPVHVPRSVADFLVATQDASGGFGFRQGEPPNVFATRSAAMLVAALQSQEPSSDLETVRARIIDFVESLRVPEGISYYGFRQPQTAVSG